MVAGVGLAGSGWSRAHRLGGRRGSGGAGQPARELILTSCGRGLRVGPDPGAFGGVDHGSVPAVAAFEVADPSFAAAPPLDVSSEGSSSFVGLSGLAGSGFAGITTSLTPRSCRSFS